MVKAIMPLVERKNGKINCHSSILLPGFIKGIPPSGVSGKNVYKNAAWVIFFKI